MTRLTVFTPTYNRATTLPRLYESLMGQSVHDLEWLVVDDGSTDDTEGVIATLAEGAPFPVRYFAQPNGGKHAAMNRGVALAEGELFWTVDSDDWLADEAVARMLALWDDIPPADREGVAALTGLCSDPQGAVIGDIFPADAVLSNSLEMSLVHGVRGDKAGWTRSDVMRRHPFPEGAHDFVPEGIVWNAIALKYSTLYVNEVVLVADYRNDGFSRGGNQVSPLGMAMYHASLLNEAGFYLEQNRRALLRSAASYSRFSRSSGVSWRELVGQVRGLRRKALVLALGPAGFALRMRDRSRG